MFPPPSSSSTPPPKNMKKLSTTTIHIMALDGIINVNSLFTLGLFLGLTLYPTTATTSTTTTLVPPPCSAGPAVEESLVSCHVYSFSCFLFSSLLASALKQGIKIANGGGGDGEDNARFGLGVGMVRVNLMVLRFGILLSSFGSVFGCGFLTMALVDLVQIKLGVLGCRSFYTLFAICPLVTLVPLALIIYVCLVVYAFSR